MIVKPFFTDYQSVLEASRYLQVYPETIKRQCRSGLLRASKFGNAWLVPRSELDEFSRTYIPRRGARSKYIQH